MPHHQPIRSDHKPCNPHPKCCLLFLGTRDDHPVRSPVWPLCISSLRGAKEIAVTTRVKVGFRCGTPQLRSGRERETSALLGTPTPMHSRKKLQKKETSAPIPKKYLEYEVSQGPMCCCVSGRMFLCESFGGSQGVPGEDKRKAESEKNRKRNVSDLV